jgi:hypothetical protein
MDKFGRHYYLLVQADTESKEQTVIITLPFSMQFNIARRLMSSANTAKITLYNLARDTREKLYKDKHTTAIYKGIELRAGYSPIKAAYDSKEYLREVASLPLIFKGNIKQAYSERRGTDYITAIEAYDGGFAFINSYTKASFMAGTPVNQILDGLIKTLPAVNKGAIGDFSNAAPRGNAYEGTTTKLLSDLTGGRFFIDNEKAYCLQDNECIAGNIAVITSESGLLGSPRREETFLEFDILFEPRILIGQVVELRSETETQFNGLRKVIGFTHKGMISETVNGQCITSVSLYYGAKQLFLVK